VLGQARPRLAPGAWLLLEHGYDQQESVSALAEAAGYRVAERLRDLAGHPRVLVLQPS
jgi:release factor glutamine methyltransferase